MVDASERMKGVDPLDLLDKCKRFLGKRWANVDKSNFDLKVLTAGFGNRLFVCSTSSGDQPEKVLVRLYGGNVLSKDLPFRILTEASECIVFYALAEKGWAPKLHGVFDGGRVEEYIPSRLFTIDEFCDDPDISLAMARAIARYHTLEVPAPKLPVDFAEQMHKTHEKHRALVASGLPPLPPPVSDRHAKAMEDLINFDLTKESDWFRSIAPKIPSRLVFIHGDVNRGNTLCRLQETDSSGRRLTWDERIVLVDYEFSQYDLRGFDISNHFQLQVYDYGQDQWIMHKDYPTEERQRAFIREYIAESKRLGHYDDWDDNGLDSEDHILLECDFYLLATRLSTLAWALHDIVGLANLQEARKNVDPEFTEQGGVASFVYQYRDYKDRFLKKYPQYAN